MLGSGIQLKHSILGDEDDEVENIYDREELSLLEIALFIGKKIVSYKDILFLLLFLIQLLTVFSLAVSSNIKGLNTIIIDSNDNTQTSLNNTSSSFIVGIIIVIISSIFISLLWIYIIAYFAKDIITFSFGTSILLSFGTGIVNFVNGNVLNGVALIAVACVILTIFIYFKPRIHFATTMITLATSAVKEMPSTILIAIAVMLVEFSYIVVWSIAVFGLASYHKNTIINGYDLSTCKTYEYTNSITINSKQLICSSGKQCKACFCDQNFISNEYCSNPKIYSGSYFILLLLLFWTSSVLSNVLNTSMAGCIAAWWSDIYKPSNNVLKKCFLRSCTTSLGSIAFGSLICALIKTIRIIFKFSADKISYFEVNNSTVSKIRNYLITFLQKGLSLIDKIARYFSNYAFIYLALYDLSFIEASSKVMNLFDEKGLTLIINDDIVEGIFFLSSNVVGILTLFTASFYSNRLNFNRYLNFKFYHNQLISFYHHQLISFSTDTILLYSFAYVSGLFLSKILLTVLSASVSAIFVCYIESPEIFQSTHPELYNSLSKSWKQIYPVRLPHMLNEDIESEEKPGPYQPPQVREVTATYSAVSTYEKLTQPVTDYVANFLKTNKGSENRPLSELEDDGEEEEVNL